MKLSRHLTAFVVGIALATGASATVFDVTSIGGTMGYHTAAGTSNDVGWNLSSTFIAWGTTNGTYSGFTGANFNPALPNTDAIHIFGSNFTLTFDKTISSIIFFLRENGGTSTLDFGLTPTVLSGNLIVSGTKVRGTVEGGVIRFDNLDTKQLVHKTTILDGMDAAWVAQAKVPETGSTLLLLIGALVACLRLRRWVA